MTLNRQGPDIGSQYRSAIFYHDDDQKRQAELKKKQLNETQHFPKPIVTEITAASHFLPCRRVPPVLYRKATRNVGFKELRFQPRP